ncbi:1-acylglycerol-3-phosphate O-acyltransferase ABHD5-like isoform X2 [Ornithodoros turicata]|uniref:1-acylglycerol-3-phosphate O-acyltransferase ABHD5-like isoform X2 n=1 Tax=Ornithodoros turicata TaxID=34597 RepID=UPI003138B8F0
MVFEEWSTPPVSKGSTVISKYLCLALRAVCRWGEGSCRHPPPFMHRHQTGWLSGYLRWCPTSPEQLEQAEKTLLKYVKNTYSTRYVPIQAVRGCSGQHHIWSLEMKPPGTASEKLPLVMVHGFASGLALWVLNLDELSRDRPVYCFDLLGFGRSSRPTFSSDAIEVEQQFVESIENWRKSVGLERFILLGHSMGGFLASAYALLHPSHVAHLVLADPWGFPERHLPSNKTLQLPAWVKAVSTVLRPFNPLAGLRAAGPLGPRLVEKVRPDIQKKYEHVITNPEIISSYIYHCNAQTPSGEAAFKAMSTQFGWAKHPMVNRILDLHKGVPMTFIYGSRSWIDKQPGIHVQRLREDSDVDIEILDGAGHHVYADRPDLFNDVVSGICRSVDDFENVGHLPARRSSWLQGTAQGCVDLEDEKSIPASMSFASENPW